jgi:hypothetical protein
MTFPGPYPADPYVPGRTARPDEGAYDALRDTARPGMSACALRDSAAWQAGLAFLDAGFFWEAHEVLEPVWMALPDDSPERAMTQAVIQLANAALKTRMGKPRAALRLCDIVAALVAGIEASGQSQAMGLSPGQVLRASDRVRGHANLGQSVSGVAI